MSDDIIPQESSIGEYYDNYKEMQSELISMYPKKKEMQFLQLLVFGLHLSY